MKYYRNPIGLLLILLYLTSASSYDLSAEPICECPENQNAQLEWSEMCHSKRRTWIRDTYGIVYEDRPAWIDDDKYVHLEQQMQIAHYGTYGRNTLEICHRLSWVSIRCILDEEFRNAMLLDKDFGYDIEHYQRIYDFILLVGTPDVEAVVNLGCWDQPYQKNDFQNKDWWQNWFYKQHGTKYLNDELRLGGQRLVKRVKDILEGVDEDVYLNFWIEFTDPRQTEINKKAIKEILRIANSLPANLRYGPGGTNRKIGKCFDPMGNAQGGLTTIEQYMILNYQSFIDVKGYANSFYNASLGPEVNTCPSTINAKYTCKIRSTTGFYEQYNTANKNFWWYVGVPKEFVNGFLKNCNMPPPPPTD